MSLDLIAACERRIVNAWPAIDTLVMEDWVVRLAGGYSGRANSASPLRAGARMDEDLLAAVTGLYRAAGLVPCIRITPLADPSVTAMIEARGFVQRDASIGMIAPLGQRRSDAEPAVSLSPVAGTDWVRGVSALQTGAKKNADASLAAIVGRIRLPAAFATLTGGDGVPAAFGVCVVERGMAEIGSIVVAPDQRRRGHARELVETLMGFARRAGAQQAFLQVEQGNEPAMRLYQALGYSELYRYRTMILPAGEDR